MKLTPLQHAERALEKAYFAQCQRYAKNKYTPICPKPVDNGLLMV